VNKRATISEVAQMAGVSRAAVSKVLRNAYGLSDEMRRKVNEAMSALNYRPQTAARGLRGSTYTIGVLLPEIRNPFFPDILDGIVHRLEGTQYQPLLGVRLSAEKNESSIVEAMMDRKLDGFIMIAPLLNHDYIANVAKYVPTVVIGRHDREGGFDTVNNDDEAGAHLAVDHLVSLGHKRIAHVSLEPLFEGSGNNPMTFRLGGPEHDRALALELLSGKDRPTAIFAWMDSVALTIMSAARELGLRVPQDLSVTGYDNSHIGALSQLSLTSIDQSANLLGEKSAQLLFERMEGRAEDVSFIVPPRLVARGSAGRLGGEGGI
jgi:DNA-binding LacI/PurR family transcriptional regulator